MDGLHTDIDKFLPGYFLRRDQDERTNNILFPLALFLLCILLYFWGGPGLWSARHPDKGSNSKVSGVEHYLRDTAMADNFAPMKSGCEQISTKKSILSDRQLQFKEK